MAVKIRLKRRGRKGLALYDLVVADARAPRDGRFIEKIGIYRPNTNPAEVSIAEDRALSWLLQGAEPTHTARALLSYRGVMYRKHLLLGIRKEALSVEEAEKRFAKWLKEKETRIVNKEEGLKKKSEANKQKRKLSEQKVNETRAEEQAKRLAEEEAPAQESEAQREEPSKSAPPPQQDSQGETKQEAGDASN